MVPTFTKENLFYSSKSRCYTVFCQGTWTIVLFHFSIFFQAMKSPLFVTLSIGCLVAGYALYRHYCCDKGNDNDTPGPSPSVAGPQDSSEEVTPRPPAIAVDDHDHDFVWSDYRSNETCRRMRRSSITR